MCNKLLTFYFPRSQSTAIHAISSSYIPPLSVEGCVDVFND